MGRSGVLWDQAPELVRRIRREGAVRWAGSTRTWPPPTRPTRTSHEQVRRLLAATQESGGSKGLLLHAANSAGTIDLPSSHLDMVRPGIAIYGYQSSDEMHTKLPLRPAMRLWGRLMQIKTLPAGSKVGYGLTYTFSATAAWAWCPWATPMATPAACPTARACAPRARRAHPRPREHGPDFHRPDRPARGDRRRRGGYLLQRSLRALTASKTWREWSKRFPTN